MLYQKPKMELIQLEVTDIITDSVTDGGNATETTEPTVPTPPTWG